MLECTHFALDHSCLPEQLGASPAMASEAQPNLSSAGVGGMLRVVQ